MSAPTLDSGVIHFGVYTCQRCKKEYTVNKPGSWQRCTPLYCHDCTSSDDAAIAIALNDFYY